MGKPLELPLFLPLAHPRCRRASLIYLLYFRSDLILHSEWPSQWPQTSILNYVNVQEFAQIMI